LSWTNTAELIRLVEAAQAGDSIAALVGTSAARCWCTREKATGLGFILADGKIDNVPAIVTASMPADAVSLQLCPRGLRELGAARDRRNAIGKQRELSRGIVAIRAIQSLDFGIVHAPASPNR
jgi:hypothetical protein